METWITGFLKDYGAMATVLAATVALGIPARIRLGAMSQKIASLDDKFDFLNRRVDALDQKIDQNATALDQKIDQNATALDQKIDQNATALDKKIDERVGALELNMNQRFASVEQRLSSIEADIRTEIRPAIVHLQESVSHLARDLAVQNERISHLRDLIDERLPKRAE